MVRQLEGQARKWPQKEGCTCKFANALRRRSVRIDLIDKFSLLAHPDYSRRGGGSGNACGGRGQRRGLKSRAESVNRAGGGEILRSSMCGEFIEYEVGGIQVTLWSA